MQASNLSLSQTWTFSGLKLTAQVGMCIILTGPTLEIYMEIFSFTHLERGQGVLLFFLNGLRVPGPRIVGLGSKKIN